MLGNTLPRFIAGLADLGWVQIVTAGVAVYGAFLATLTFVFQRRSTRALVRVQFATGLTPGRSGLVQTVFILKAQNHGQRTVHVQQPQLQLADGKQLVFPFKLDSDVTFPFALAPEQSCTALLPAAELVRSLRKNGYSGTVTIRASFTDQLGRTHRSHRFPLEVEKWERIAAEDG